jgi:glycine cleavage system H protein
MVVILVVLTFAVIILGEIYLMRRRNRARKIALASVPDRLTETDPVPENSEDLFFHPGHTWARAAPRGMATVGVSDFAANFAGDLLAVELPKAGRRLRQGEPVCTLTSKRGRRLDLLMPVAGEILAVNPKLRGDPGIVQRHPYGIGWLLCVRARKLRDDVRNLLHGGAASMWRDANRASLTAQLTPSLGVMAHDGGIWTAAFGDLLGDDAWKSVKKDLFPAGGTDATEG